LQETPILPVGRIAAQRLASPALNGSLLLASLKQALSDEGFFLSGGAARRAWSVSADDDPFFN
jgi:hypothetical protein